MQKLYQSINKILKLALRLSFVTYSAVPARRLLFALPVSFLYPSYIECKGYLRRKKRFCKLAKCFVYLSLENKRN